MPKQPDNISAALKQELDRIEKEFGKGTIISSSLRRERVEVISTGSLSLDLATGIGGLPRGKVVEIMGWESSGKSTIVLQTIANAQKQGLKCLLVDGEESFDLKYAKALGVNVDDLLIKQLDEHGGEGCYDIAEGLIRTRGLGMVVFDSQTSLLPKKVLNGSVTESAMGVHSRLMSQSVPKIVNAAGYSNTLVIYVSQFREKIGVIYGPTETTNGGNALKFYAHMRIEAKKSVLRDEKTKEAYANKTLCKVVKNKMAVPFKEANFRINFGKGVDRVLEVMDLAEELEIFEKKGSWYYYNKERYENGEQKMYDFMVDNPEFTRQIENTVIEKVNETNTITEDIPAEKIEVEGHEKGYDYYA